jgi:dUTPase
MANIIKFLKTRDVKTPTRANKYDAGIDFYIPEFTPEFIQLLQEKNPEIYITDKFIVLASNERVLIPSGIYCQMAWPDRALIAANKGGVSTKLGLTFTCEVVDYEYQGEIHIGLANTSDGAVKLTPGMKAIQFIETPVFISDIEVSEGKTPKEFYEFETTRGVSGFGASDKK